MEDSWSNEAFRPITRDEKYLMNYNQNYSLLINSKSTKKVNLPFSRGGGEEKDKKSEREPWRRGGGRKDLNN